MNCRADPSAGPCANIFCPACRTARAFPLPPEELHRIKSILGGKARARDGSLAKAAGEARKRAFAAMTPEERQAAMAPLQAARIAALKRRGWPFQPKPKLTKVEAIAVARAALKAKLAREKLARQAAKKRGDASRRRPGGATSSSTS